MIEPLFSIRDLRVRLGNQLRGRIDVVNGVDLELHDGEIVAVVGEGGCGKTTLIEVLTGLIDEARCEGRAHLRGFSKNLLRASERELRMLRGGRISYLFGGMRDSLHAHVSIREQMKEVLEIHRPEVKNFDEEIIYWLSKVGIADPEGMMPTYAWNLNLVSRIRIGVALALGTLPRLLIADEPTEGLDQSNREELLDLIKSITSSAGTTVLLVTRDIRVACKVADRIAVMGEGRIVESGEAALIVRSPTHPLTRELLRVTPGMEIPPS